MAHGAWSMGQLVLRNNTLLILKFSTMFLLAQILFSLQFELHAPCAMPFLKFHLEQQLSKHLRNFYDLKIASSYL
jgi:hypothetical protein